MASRAKSRVRELPKGVKRMTPTLPVFCLISALHFYGLTTQIPHKVYIALPQAAEKPRLDFPPLDIIWLSVKSYNAGITGQQVDGVPIKIYSREKTIADCFKFRSKVGIDATKPLAYEGHVFTKVRIPGEESVDLNQVLDPSVSIESFLNEK